MRRESELLIEMWNKLQNETNKVVTEENYDAIKKAIACLELNADKYKRHWDHTDCIWYTNENSTCPCTCAQYRDGWNDCMDYLFKDGLGYRPYKRS